ncbi:hypothetical protein O6H91_21G057900 [Diphasiastrum complanatum]|uniref:Uncharacterized protein n=1 Tax=Diphasiastrum complanatum TaxID=34168 RepID=A0ACC2AKV3_DIPCM|nr:hypothetical protein O6H91_Y420200 [Diphasiastrum complanatum]KAJ7518170.1 hypothetical protein O6H91_21G057900 [Diphasiastrum complanatum]
MLLARTLGRVATFMRHVSQPTKINASREIATIGSHERRCYHDLFADRNPSANKESDGLEACTGIWISSFRNPGKVYGNVSGYLKDINLWITAYLKVCHELRLWTPNSRIDESTISALEALRHVVLTERYAWGKSGPVYLTQPKLPDSPAKTIEDSLPDFQNRIVQEILMMILEPLYEARFSPRSHAFRPGRSPHTALRYVQGNFPGTVWYLKGDVSNLFDGIQPAMMANTLSKVIRDSKIVKLVRTGVVPVPKQVEEKVSRLRNKEKPKWSKMKKKNAVEPKRNPFWLDSVLGFAPEEAQKRPNWGNCKKLSPLLSNIYLHELDKWMDEQMQAYFRPHDPDSDCNELDPEEGLADQDDEGAGKQQADTDTPDVEDEKPNQHNLETGESQETNRNKPGAGDIPPPLLDKSKRMEYVRYGAHFLVGMQGPRADAERFREDLRKFCSEKLQVDLSVERCPIFHVTKKIPFLGHEITRRKLLIKRRRLCDDGKVRKVNVMTTILTITASMDDCARKLRLIGVLKGRDDPQPCFRLFHAEQIDTNAHINKLLRGLSEWYRYAMNRKKVSAFLAYVFRSSLAKLYAAKYKLRSQAKVYKVAGKDLSRPLKDRVGRTPAFRAALRRGIRSDVQGLEFRWGKFTPAAIYSPLPRDWEPVHEKLLKEIAGLVKPEFLAQELELVKKRSPRSIHDDMSALVWSFYHEDFSSNEHKTKQFL